jgi:signal transduction histidine kinase
VEATDLPTRHARSYVKVLERLCGDDDLPGAAGDVLDEVARAVGCETISLRVYDWRGGFSCVARVGLGNVIAADDEPSALMRIREIVTSGSADPSRSYFTSGGSFWTDSLGTLLAGELGEEFGRAPRDAEGYESVVIAPVRSNGHVLGIVEAAGREQGIFSPTDVQFLERVALRLGGSVEVWRRHEELLAHAALFDDRRRSAESMLAIGQMLSSIAHDIKNPLAGMMLAAQRLKRSLHAFQGQEKLACIADHLCVSIDKLSGTTSEVSRHVREPVLEMSREDIHEVLDSVTALLARRAGEQEVKIIRDFAARRTCVRGDAHFLRRAFLNLITNALDAMPRGGELFVSTTTPERGMIEVVIGDTGGGFGPSDNVEKLFSPFVSALPGRAGLGLPLVRRIVELHGGTVSLGPRPAGGAEAVVRIPLAAPEAPA